MIRIYKPKDKSGLLQLLQLNTPQFFHPSEEKDFSDYLDMQAQNYFVVEQGKQIIASGGYNLGFENGETARISWDMIHPEYQKMGIGSQLTEYRIAEIKKQAQIQKIVLRTSQYAFGFYEKLGFKLERVERNYWAKGFDLYEMRLLLYE